MPPNLFLDRLAQRGNPIAAGLVRGPGALPDLSAFTPQQPAPTAALPQQQQGGPSGGLLSALQTVFSGRNSPFLSKDENDLVRRDALMQAGLAILSSQAEDPSASFTSVLAKGAIAAREYAADARQQLFSQKLNEEALLSARQERSERVAKEIRDAQGRAVIGRMDPFSADSRDQAMSAAAAIGNLDIVQRLYNFDTDIREEEGQTAATMAWDQMQDSIDWTDEQEVAAAAARFTAQGPEGAIMGEKILAIAESAARLKNAGVRTIDKGDEIVLVDGEGNTIKSYEKGISPYQMESIYFQQANLELAREQLGQQVVSNMNTVADDFRLEADDDKFVADAASIAFAPPEMQNAASDISLLSALTRVSDPGATVRNDDIARGERIGDLADKTQALINRYVTAGGQLGPEGRQLVMDEIRRIYELKATAFTDRLVRFSKRALSVGGDPDLILFNPYNPGWRFDGSVEQAIIELENAGR